MSRWRMLGSRRQYAAVAIAVGAMSAAGFGATSSGATTTARGHRQAQSSAHRASVLWPGPLLHIPAGKNPAVHGKTIGVVTLTSASEVFPRELAAIKAATKVLGWHVDTANMNGDVAQAATAVENLLSEGVKGIILQSIEPSWIGAQAVADAHAKHVPIIETFSGVKPAASGGVLTGEVGNSYAGAERLLDKQIAADIGQGGQIGLIIDQLASEGQQPQARLESDLAGKEHIVATHQMNYANLVPDVVSTVSAWLTQYPALKAVWCPYDGACVGAAQAIVGANKPGVRVFSMDGVSTIINDIRAGQKITTVAQPLEYANWVAVDMLNSIFARRKHIVNYNVPSVIVDRADVPKRGYITGTQMYGNFEAAFEKRWGVAG